MTYAKICREMMNMKVKNTQIINKHFDEERALFQSKSCLVKDCTFDKGESPLKESEDIRLENCTFSYKYPLWYSKDIEVNHTTWNEMARAGVWYTKNINVIDAMIIAPKNFRRCEKLTLKNVKFPNALETLWNCKDIVLNNVEIHGDYFGMNCKDIYVDHLTVDGNYCFDGVKNVEIHHAKLNTKDAFWNSKNITIYDSYISGEYLGCNSKNLTFINCTIESLQGLCYIENLVMKNCTFVNTTLAFEYSSCDVEINGDIDSILNPSSGVIKVDHIKELIIQKDKIDPSKVKIICDHIDAYLDEPHF